MKNIIIAAIMMLGITAKAQVKIGDNLTTVNPDSALELESTNKGLLLTRVALVQTTNPSPLSAHVQGMLVYNTATTGDVQPGIYENDGAKWELLNVSTQTVAMYCNGFEGNWAVGAYSRTFKATYANNSLFAASVTPAVGDLVLSPSSGLTVASVSPNTSTAIPAGGTLQVTFTMGGTLSASYGTMITGTHTKTGQSCSSVVTVGNNTPAVEAGNDQNVVQPASTASLTGTASDVDGTIASVMWTQTSGPSAIIASPNTVTTGISGLSVVGAYVFTLTATDDRGAASSDSVTIYVINTFTGPGSSFSSAPTGVYSGQTAAFSANTTCTAKTISVTPCSAQSGVTLNDDAATTMGTEYDWTGGTAYVAGNIAGTDNNTRALVEINNQCWFRKNAINSIPTTGAGTYPGNSVTPVYANEGRYYTFSAAMNGSLTERGQGICPTGWHVPSDCEWMFLEHSLGMTTAQQISASRSNTTGSRLSAVVGSPNNLSGFTGLLAGYSNGTSRNTYGIFWTSATSNATANRRYLQTAQTSFYRNVVSNQNYSVRCLKD